MTLQDATQQAKDTTSWRNMFKRWAAGAQGHHHRHRSTKSSQSHGNHQLSNATVD